jgi:hypothetical protein
MELGLQVDTTEFFVDTVDILTGNVKLILGLVWKLVLHFQIRQLPGVSSQGFNFTQDDAPRQTLYFFEVPDLWF